MCGGGPQLSLSADRSDRHRRKEVGGVRRVTSGQVPGRALRTDPEVSLGGQPRDADLHLALSRARSAGPSRTDRRLEGPREGLRTHRCGPLAVPEHLAPHALAPDDVTLARGRGLDLPSREGGETAQIVEVGWIGIDRPLTSLGSAATSSSEADREVGDHSGKITGDHSRWASKGWARRRAEPCVAAGARSPASPRRSRPLRPRQEPHIPVPEEGPRKLPLRK